MGEGSYPSNVSWKFLCFPEIKDSGIALAGVAQLVGVLSCALKSCQFDSWVLGLIPSGMGAGGSRLMFRFYIDVSLPPSLKVNNFFFLKTQVSFSEMFT